MGNELEYGNTERVATIGGRGSDLKPHFYVELLFGNGLMEDREYQGDELKIRGNVGRGTRTGCC